MLRTASVLAMSLGCWSAAAASVPCGSAAGASVASTSCGSVDGVFTVTVIYTPSTPTFAQGSADLNSPTYHQVISGVIHVGRSLSGTCPEGCDLDELPATVAVRVAATFSGSGYVLDSAAPTGGLNNILSIAQYSGPGGLLFQPFSYAGPGSAQPNLPSWSSTETATVDLAPGDHAFTLQLDGYVNAFGTAGGGNPNVVNQSAYLTFSVGFPSAGANGFQVTCIPEPQSLALALSGLLVLPLVRRQGR